MESRVQIENTIIPGDRTGVVVGIASMHVMFTYIVLLDGPPFEIQGDLLRAITVSGCQLKVL